jgi:predicted MFS family arabinose efflux permease
MKRASSTHQATGNGSLYSWYALALLFATYVINVIDRHIINILVEPIQQDLGLSDTQIGFVTGLAFAMFYTVMGIPLAVLADRWHRTRLVCLCSSLWSLMSMASGASRGFFTLSASRMGVGLGEAGLTPTANSLIGDLFPPANRGKALGIYISAVPMGTMLAGLIGGWLASTWGWRPAFYAVGVAGLVLTAIFWLSFREPERGRYDATSSAPEKMTYSILEVIAHLLAKRSCRYFFPAFAIIGFVGAAINNWTPAFFMRSHGMDLMQMAASIGLIFGIGGAAGMIAGGWMADGFARRNPSAYLHVPALAIALGLPLYFAAFLVHDTRIAMFLLVVPVTVAAVVLPPVLALLQRLTKNNMRAVSIAIFLIVVHLAGMGFGPLLAGALSDLLQPAAGEEALRYALLCIIPLNLVAAILFWRGARHVAEDIGEG